MSVGLITRQSIRKALSNEISADLVWIEFISYLSLFFVLQILNFLKSHAHPQMRKRV